MNIKQAIIFDLEGVVIDTEPIWDEINIEFLARRNIKPDLHAIKLQTMGRTIEEGIAVMMKDYGFKGNLTNMVNERRKIAENLLLKEINFIAGFEDFFKSVKDLYQVAVATSMERLFFNDVDKRLNLTHLFNGHIYSIEDIGFVSKPNPEIFLHAAFKLGVKPQDCTVIEDSPHGVTAANRAHMYSIAITTTTTKEKLEHADLIVDKYNEIKI